MQQVKLRSGMYLKVWEPIEILVGEGSESGLYRSRIEDFINGGILVTEPEFIGGSSRLRNDIDVYVNVTREDAVYQFSSRIRRQSSSKGRSLFLTPPRGVRRVQRRLFCRVEISEKIRYAAIEASMDWDDYDEQLTWCESASRDISGGGLLLRTEAKMEVDQLVLLRMNFLKEAGVPEMIVGVCRRGFIQEKQPMAGIEFLVADRLGKYFSMTQRKCLPPEVLRFDSPAQDQLVNYIFNKQIDMRAKGLL